MAKVARCICGLMLVLMASVTAQDGDVVRRLERQLRQIDSTYRMARPSGLTSSERMMVDYGLTGRFGFYAIDDSFGTTHIMRQSDAILHLNLNLDAGHQFFGRARLLYNDWNSGDSFDGDGDELEEPIVDRLWYQFDARQAIADRTGASPDWNFNAKVGRQYIEWGSGLALAQTMDAALLDLEVLGIGLTGIAALTPTNGVVDFDSTRPHFDDDTDRAYYGGAIEGRWWADHSPYAYLLLQRDENDRNMTIFRQGAFSYPTRYSYDSEYLGVGMHGSLLGNLQYDIEVVHESGETLSNSFSTTTFLPIAQTKDDIDAWAGQAELTYLFRDVGASRIDLGFSLASGDDDRLSATSTFGGNAPGTDDDAFNSLGYVASGLALAPSLTNLAVLRFGGSTTPFAEGRPKDWLRVGVEGFIFNKVDDDAPISIGITDPDGFVGSELDASIEWRIFSDLGASARYGVFFPGDAIHEHSDKARHFFYMGMTYGF